MTDRQTTHAPGCWSWGPRHYECAVGQIERDESLLRQALEALEALKAENEMLREALKDAKVEQGEVK